jgi:FdhD protein
MPPRSIALTQVTEYSDGSARRLQDSLAGEEPLEIRVNGESFAVTMRTPGQDAELAAGLLFTESVIQTRDQIASIKEAHNETAPGSSPPSTGNVLEIILAPNVLFDPASRRNFHINSSCGICGKSSIDEVRSKLLRAPKPYAAFQMSAATLLQLPEKLSGAQGIFDRTGGLHAAGLFDRDANLLVAREDIGRHNAVDKIIGWALAENKIPLHNYALLVSGRCGFEIAQKGILAGLPLVTSVSAPSSLAVQLARELNLTLVGFLRGKRFVVYSGEGRLSLTGNDGN